MAKRTKEKKSAVKRFFDPENTFWSWLTRLPEICGLSLVWLLCSLPVLTLVPSTIALYDAAARNLRPDEKGMYRRFFRTFKNELGKGILIELFWLVLGALLYLGFDIMQRSEYTALALIYQISCLLPLGIFCWVVSLQSRFVYSFWQLHKNAAILALANLPKTGLMLLILVLALILCWWVPVLVVPMPALLALLHSIPVEVAFEKLLAEKTQE